MVSPVWDGPAPSSDEGWDGVPDDVRDQVTREFQEGRLADLFFAEREQRLAAKIQGERSGLRIGDIPMQIAPAYYHYWGQRLGYECWEDEQFVREILRDNPECRVKCKTGKIQVGYGDGEIRRAWAPNLKKVKFHKVYG